MRDEDLLATVAETDPVGAVLLREAWEALDVLRATFDQLKNAPHEQRVIGALNASVCALLAIGDAMDKAGRKPGRAEFRAEVLAAHKSRLPKDFELGHWRAIRTAVAYKDKARLESSGSNDTPIEAAMQVAALYEALYDGLDIQVDTDTIRKSIQRFRAKIKGASVVKLDEETMTFEVHDAESVTLAGLPGKPGRPKRRGQS